MRNISSLASKVFKSPALLYVISRYGTYIIQFINSLFIAVYLGPYYLGIWGFINLVLGYLGQINFGISHSVNVIVSIEKENIEYVKKIIGNGLSMIAGLSILIILFFLLSYVGIFTIGERYEFNKYLIPVSIIAIVTHFNSLFSNIFRIYGKIISIAISQSLFPILTFIIIPFFRGSELLWAMVIVNSISLLVSLIIFLEQAPIKFRLQFNFNLIKYIQNKGWHLFVYNTSFYLILLVTKSFISGNFSIEEYGYFTFSYSLSNAILLFLNSLSYLVFPKMLNLFANTNNDHIQNILLSIRTAYISSSHILIHFLIMIFPIVLLIFPNYSPAINVFKVTALTIVLYTNSFGYQAVLMAKSKEKQIAILAFSALLLNILIVPYFVYKLNIQFSYVMFATMIVYFIYVLMLGYLGRRELRLSTKFTNILKDVFPLRMFIPFILSIGMILLSVDDFYFIMPFIVYIILNHKDFKKLIRLIHKVINNPNLINI